MRNKSIHTHSDAPGSRAAEYSAVIVALLIAGGSAGCFLYRNYFETGAGLASLVIFVVFQWGLPRWLHLRWPVWLRFAASLIALVSVFFGRFFALYSRWPGFDKSQHLLYGFIFTLLGFTLFLHWIPSDRSGRPTRLAPVLLAASGFSILICVVWELFEYISDRLTGSNMQSWQDGDLAGLTDTMIDLAFDLAGILLAVLLLTVWKRLRGEQAVLFFQPVRKSSRGRRGTDD